jgi:hypothetical protein
LNLLNTAREKTEAMIDMLFEYVREQVEVKPRTYRKVAREKYLAESKKDKSIKRRSEVLFDII